MQKWRRMRPDDSQSRTVSGSTNSSSTSTGFEHSQRSQAEAAASLHHPNMPTVPVPWLFGTHGVDGKVSLELREAHDTPLPCRLEALQKLAEHIRLAAPTKTKMQSFRFRIFFGPLAWRSFEQTRREKWTRKSDSRNRLDSTESRPLVEEKYSGVATHVRLRDLTSGCSLAL